MNDKRKREAIAIDFDGCLCANAYPDIGAPNWDVVTAARQRQKAGARLILWTCREGKMLEVAVSAAERWGLHFDAVNENLPEWKELWGSDPRKVGATEYWDDRAVKVDLRGCVACDTCARAGANYCHVCGRALKLSGVKPAPVTLTMADEVLDAIGLPACLEQLAEEAAELAQAALKLARIHRGENPTPVTPSVAGGNLAEEAADVLLCLKVLSSEMPLQDFVPGIMNQKLDRWIQRLGVTG